MEGKLTIYSLIAISIFDFTFHVYVITVVFFLVTQVNCNVIFCFAFI